MTGNTVQQKERYYSHLIISFPYVISGRCIIPIASPWGGTDFCNLFLDILFSIQTTLPIRVTMYSYGLAVLLQSL